MTRASYSVEVALAYGIPAAVVFAKVAYLSRYTKKPGGWCWKSIEDMRAETGLTRHQQRAAIDALEVAGLIETRNGRTTGKRGPVRHYRLTEKGAAVSRAENRLNVEPKIGSTGGVVEPKIGSTNNRKDIYRKDTRARACSAGGRAALGKKEQLERERELEAEWQREFAERKKAAGGAFSVIEGGKE